MGDLECERVEIQKRMKIRDWSVRGRGKVEKRMGTLGKSKSVSGRFCGIQREKDQSRRGVPRENSRYIVLICFPR